MNLSQSTCMVPLAGLLAWCFCLHAPPAVAETNEPPSEQLIVFIDSSGTALQERFRADTLPKLEALSQELGVRLEVFDVTKHGAAPPEVGITPLIAFQNWRGRSIYQGRYETLDRVRNFVRTARFMPQDDAPLVREDVPVWDRGRMKVVTPIKVTDFQGPGLPGVGGQDPVQRARKAIDAGMTRFETADRVELGRSDRQWYVDFHPYVAQDKTLYVSTELYSQFHCHEPVFSTLGDPVSGKWSDFEDVFAEAAAKLEEEIVRQLRESELGDGFDVVKMEASSWDDLGLALPEKPETSNADAGDVELSADWQVDVAAQDAQPAVQFAFPAPLDGYSGEATKVRGTLKLGDGLKLAGASGRFDADPASVTMGEDDLDAHIHNGILDVEKHPASYFVFDRVEVESAQADRPLTFGQIVPAALVGDFTMKGITIPLTVPASVEAFVGEDGRPRLSITGQWTLALNDPFAIEGPPGPAEASNRLRFACRIVLEPSGE